MDYQEFYHNANHFLSFLGKDRYYDNCDVFKYTYHIEYYCEEYGCNKYSCSCSQYKYSRSRSEYKDFVITSFDANGFKELLFKDVKNESLTFALEAIFDFYVKDKDCFYPLIEEGWYGQEFYKFAISDSLLEEMTKVVWGLCSLSDEEMKEYVKCLK
jgi:hypothetical protein